MEEVNSKYKVLFVCLGNICRSPAAHGIFEHVVREKGMEDKIEVDSAGTYSGHRGELPDRRMRNAAMYRGYALTHRSRPVSSLDFLDFDMIIAMDDQNYEDLMHLAPSVEATHKIRRMAEFFTTHKISYVPDPYYMGAEGFQLVLDLLEEEHVNLGVVVDVQEVYATTHKLCDSVDTVICTLADICQDTLVRHCVELLVVDVAYTSLQRAHSLQKTLLEGATY